jgi:hypothetical protein
LEAKPLECGREAAAFSIPNKKAEASRPHSKAPSGASFYVRIPIYKLMGEFRTEHDLLGTRDVPADALYGIYTERAIENFPLSLRSIHPALIHAYGAVKLACARTNHELGRWNEDTFKAMKQHVRR